MAIFQGYQNPALQEYYNQQDQQRAIPASTGVTDAYKLYNSGVQQNAQDYGNIMDAYKNMPSNPAVTNMNDLATTGGYTAQNQADIRERGISPIRSIYSSASQNVDRQKNLAGGYAPNAVATQARMARDMSGIIADKTTAVNADLAQNIASNRLSAAPHAVTTPALANTFGDQAYKSASLQNDINQAPAVTPSNLPTQPSQPGSGIFNSVYRIPTSQVPGSNNPYLYGGSNLGGY
jgi:hypothetical protein